MVCLCEKLKINCKLLLRISPKKLTMKLKGILLWTLLLCNWQHPGFASVDSRETVAAQATSSNLWRVQARKDLSASASGEETLPSLLTQITPDDSLGDENSTVAPDTEVQGVPAELIEGGAERGANLFHSFEEFNVGDGQNVYFANPEGIANIFSRVTGRDVSDIMGTLGVDGGADLFLINPNGIIFGENASLDLNGSFMATSATEIQFGEQGEFSAIDPNAPPLLTVQPSALLFNQMQPGRIESRSIVPQGTSATGNTDRVGLRVPDGNHLALIGGEITIDGGKAGAGLTALDGRIELGGLSAVGLIEISADGSLSLPENIDRADVLLSNGAILDVGKNGAGSIALTGRNIAINNSNIFAQVAPGLGAVDAQVGDVVIDATRDISLTDNSTIDNRTFGRQRAGKINIRAAEAITINSSNILNNVEGDSTADAGGIELVTQRLSVENESGIFAETFGAGNAGTIRIQADLFRVTDASLIASTSGGSGNAGNINVQTDSLALLEGGELTSFTFGEGDAGDIEVNATEITLSGTAPLKLIGISQNPGGFSSGLIGSVEQGATGAGGTIIVNTDSLELSEGAVLSARTKSTAVGGDITVNAASLTVESGGQILTSAFDAGDAGNIELNIAETIAISGSDLTFAARREGVIELSEQIDRPDLIDPEQTLDPVSPASGVFANTTESSAGDGGSVTINDSDNSTLQSITILDGGRLSVDSQGEGNGGSLQVVANNLFLDEATVSATTPSGRGGNLNLQISDLLQIDDNSLISTEASGAADGGNIEITTEFLVGSGNSDIIANAFEGRGGFIEIAAEGIFGLESRTELTEFNDITAFSQQNPQLDGTVEIVTPEENQNLELPQLQSVPVPTQVVQACEPPGSQGANEFAVTGRGGLPNTPGANLNGSFVLEDWRARQDSSAAIDGNAPPPISSTTEIVEADSWLVNDSGKVTLVADSSANQSREWSQLIPDCPTKNN